MLKDTEGTGATAGPSPEVQDYYRASFRIA